MKKFSTKKQITKSSTEKLSKKDAGVYKITDSRGETLYIGKAKAGRLGERIYEHKGHFKGGTNFRYQETGTVEKAERLEKRLVKKEAPPRNRMLKRKK